MKCPACKRQAEFKLSVRPHGQKGKSFAICSACGRECQAVFQDGKAVRVWGYKGGSNVVTLRLSDAEMKIRERLKSQGKTDRDIYLEGMSTW